MHFFESTNNELWLAMLLVLLGCIRIILKYDTFYCHQIWRVASRTFLLCRPKEAEEAGRGQVGDQINLCPINYLNRFEHTGNTTDLAIALQTVDKYVH